MALSWRTGASAVFVAGTLASAGLLIAAIFARSPTLGAAGLACGFLAETQLDRSKAILRKILRISGLSLRIRMMLRSLVMVVVIAATFDGHRWLLLGCVVLVAAVQIGLPICRVLIAKPRRGGLIRVFHNLDVEQSLVVDRRRWKSRESSIGRIFLVIELAMWVLTAILSDQSEAAGTIAAVATVIPVGIAVGWLWLAGRGKNTPAIKEAHNETVRQAILDYDPEIILYIVASMREFYFITQWLDAFNALERRAIWVVRSAPVAAKLSETPFPVVYAPDTRDVEAVIGPKTRLALYVANTGRNVHLARRSDIKHIFLNHGDSDKATSANPVARMYDEVWVAGEAAEERYASAGVELREGAFRYIGRPQVEDVSRGPLGDTETVIDEDGEHTVPRPTRVLYAPTFEGHYNDINYSSLEVMGVAMIEMLLKHRPDIAVTFRPHPNSGLHLPGMIAARGKIVELLNSSPNASHHRYVAPTGAPPLFANMNEADILISDVSSVVSDFLATSRPILISNPRDLKEGSYREMFPNQSGCYLVGTDMDAFLATFNAALSEDPLADTRFEAERRLLGIHPHGPTRTFIDAINTVYEEADQSAQAITNTFRFDEG